MRELIIMQGFSGSGKSFVRSALVDYYQGHECSRVEVCSTDDFWYSEVGNNPDEYNFDMKRLGEAHKWNQRRANDAMQKGVSVVIIDNTNITQREAEPYINMGKANGYNLRCISVSCAVEVAKKANSERPKTRQVPENVIDRQMQRMQRIHF